MKYWGTKKRKEEKETREKEEKKRNKKEELNRIKDSKKTPLFFYDKMH